VISLLPLFIVPVLLILFTTLELRSNYAYGAENWYVGKGAKPGMYLTYNVQEHDTNQGQPFTITLYFKEFDSNKHYWIVPVFVVDKGKVINGTMHLSELDLTALGTSQIPSEMKPYRSAYTSSLDWLSAFVPKPGQSLSAQYWGKIASIGGSPIAPGAQEKITVAGGSYDTKVILWHKGVDNHIWIDPNLPYPVKAETFADVTTGKPPLQYAFELLQVGQGEPKMPKSVMEIPKPPLTQETARGTYFIKLLWTPPIKAGNDTKLGILFMDNSQKVIGQVSYGLKVTTSNDTILQEVKDQKSADGTAIQTVKFPAPGSYMIDITVEAVAGRPMGMFIEESKFNIVVE
jgi:hypothetical protein